MIDLLLEVYNYLIKPRLQNLEGHRVSLKEKKEGERERERKESHILQMTECVGALGVPTRHLGLLQSLWVIFPAHHITMYLSGPSENKLPTFSFMC